eukprot:TRINITY_DN8923_c0_g1_i1.p1 TRINITY_DN8923_c0_g1~~TRINITY_DN8923_c0_g1_i1.p1  ORF type:complete len:259 (-),score=109.06 TRINITY_DN8923_c0_g1_i1:69-791(-)
MSSVYLGEEGIEKLVNKYLPLLSHYSTRKKEEEGKIGKRVSILREAEKGIAKRSTEMMIFILNPLEWWWEKKFLSSWRKWAEGERGPEEERERKRIDKEISSSADLDKRFSTISSLLHWNKKHAVLTKSREALLLLTLPKYIFQSLALDSSSSSLPPSSPSSSSSSPVVPSLSSTLFPHLSPFQMSLLLRNLQNEEAEEVVPPKLFIFLERQKRKGSLQDQVIEKETLLSLTELDLGLFK